MDIFIRRLPESVTRLDLIRFITNAQRPQWGIFRSRSSHPKVDCEIFQVTNVDTQTLEYHGVAHFDDPHEAITVINRLNGALLKAKPMEVRKYYHRSHLRDRRKPPAHPALLHDIAEKRHADRRRAQLLIEPLHAGATRTDDYGLQIRL